MVSYLSVKGFEPAKSKGINYWYYSPFRQESEPSFKVNRRRNQWYDFGEGEGGNLLDFILRFENASISEALKLLEQHKHLQAPDAYNVPADTPVIEILSVHEISSPSLIRYYQSRRIATDIASQYLQEVRYKNGEKTYYALGFKNDAGGYELRAPYFKGSSHPKSSTLIKNQADALAVFEGFFDFLSYLTIYQNQPAPLRDFLVLNSTSFFERQLPIMQAYERAHLYLDNDKTGTKCTTLALEKYPQQFIDERSLYVGYKDLNEWHKYIGTAPKPAA
ncbi:MAG: toprim domain-containing protein [Sphingobacteriales bacterium]|nr:toprim domain-containing protein [Sphingobacteriales bacterium]